MEINYLDTEDLQFLEKITPFPGIEDKLKDIITNNNFRGFPQPYLYFRDITDIDKEYSAEDTPMFPRFDLSVLDPKASLFDSIFRLTIFHEHYNLTRNGTSTSNFLYGRFSKYFEYSCNGSSEATLAMDIPTAVRLMTYCLSTYGYDDVSYLKIEAVLGFTSADKGKMILPESIPVPIAFLKAFSKLKKMYPGYYDFLNLRLATKLDKETNQIVRIHIYDYLCEPGEQEGTCWDYEEHFESRLEIERRLDYPNFDCFRCEGSDEMYDASICLKESDPKIPIRFFTDYFLYLNPNVGIDDIVVSIEFNPYDPEDPDKENTDISDWFSVSIQMARKTPQKN